MAIAEPAPKDARSWLGVYVLAGGTITRIRSQLELKRIPRVLS